MVDLIRAIESFHHPPLFSFALKQVPKTDLQKRQREQAEKKQKLKNPLFFVSATRLSIRNLGRSVTDSQLRTVLVEGTRKGLIAGKVTLEDIRLQHQAQGGDHPPFTPDYKGDMLVST